MIRSFSLDILCYVMRLRISSKPISAGFLVHCNGKGEGDATSLCQEEMAVQVPHLIFIDTWVWVGDSLLLLIRGGSSVCTDTSWDWGDSWLPGQCRSSDSPLGLSWHHPSGVLGHVVTASQGEVLSSLLNICCLGGDRTTGFSCGAWLEQSSCCLNVVCLARLLLSRSIG